MEKDNVQAGGQDEDQAAFDAGVNEGVVADGAGPGGVDGSDVSSDSVVDAGAVDNAVAVDGGAGSDAAAEGAGQEAVAGDPGPEAGQDGPGADAGAAGNHAGEDVQAVLARLEKQVQDNKSWGTRLAQENAELKKMIEDAGKSRPGDKPTAETGGEEDIPDDLKEYFTQDPGLKRAIEFAAQRIVDSRFSGMPDVAKTVAETRNEIEQLRFERAVTGGVMTGTGYVQGHPDAYQVMASEEYRTWFAVESVKNPHMMQVSDAVAAIGILDRYKEHVAAEAVRKAAPKQEGTDLKAIMETAVVKGTKVHPTPKRSDDVSDDEAFEMGIQN